MSDFTQCWGLLERLLQLRHTFGTECAARGVPLPILKELMGHEDIDTTMRYVTVTADQLGAAITRAFGAERQPVGNSATD